MSLTRRFTRQARALKVKVLTRSQWDSRYFDVYFLRLRQRPHALLPDKPVDTVVQHISVTHRSGFTRKAFASDVRFVEAIGQQRFKSGISYNVTWCPITGRIALGQPFASKGTHTINDKQVPGFSRDQNAVAIAICAIGNVGIKPTRFALRKLSRTLAALELTGVITSTYDYVPHSLFAAKDCPTEPIRAAMPEVRERAKKIVRRQRRKQS